MDTLRVSRFIAGLFLITLSLTGVPPAQAQAARLSTVSSTTALTTASNYQLNLSHVCENNQSEVHFVLLQVPNGRTPGTLTYSFVDGNGQNVSRNVAPEKRTGNVWHFRDYPPNPMPYDVTAASVAVNGQTVDLHNPHDYSSEVCGAPTNTVAP